MKFRHVQLRLLPILLLALISAGCATAKYKSNEPAGSARPVTYPIPVYAKGMTVPRPCKVIGTVSITPGSFVMFGSSMEKEMIKVMKLAHEKGADAVRFISIEKPDFTNPNYRMTAELLRYSDVWETIPISRNQLEAYLDANQQNLDPIEGIWYSGGLSPVEVGITKDHSRPKRDFVAFVLDSNNPAWQTGYKKMDIQRGPKAGSYVLNYYLNDFEPIRISLILSDKRRFTFDYQKGPDETFVTYVKK